MSTRAFRFGVVGTPQEGRERWLNLARRVEELGYMTLLMPDGLHLLSPWPSLMAAADATTTLHVGTFVVASPLRHPHVAAWDAHSLSVMSAGRFELGIGTGRPDLMKEAARVLGVADESPAKHLKQVEETIDQLRALDGDQHTPVMIAAGGRLSRSLASKKADIVALAAGPLASRDELAATVAEVREAAGTRFDQLELSSNIFLVGEQAPPWIARFIQTDVSALIEHDSLTMLRGSVDDMCAELERRRDTLGISYVTVNSAFYEALAPVVARLSGR